MTTRVCGHIFKKRPRHGLGWAVIGILILIYAAPVLPAQPDFEPVTVPLHWFHQFQLAGWYAAVEKGFYAEEGLRVSRHNLIPGNDRLSVPMNSSLNV